MNSEKTSVEVVLIHQHPPCKKCLQVKAVIEEAMAEATRDVSFREIFTGTPEAAAFGAVFSPMVLVAGAVVSAGFVPAKAGLVKLMDGEVS